MAAQLWQLYDPQGRPIDGRGARKHDAAVNGLLHASVHLWVWRRGGQDVEVLVQKRAAYKVNWPGRFDKSAGGHVFLDEEPLAAALRKHKQELGVTIHPDQVQLVGITYWREAVGDTGIIDHEFQYIYLSECNTPNFVLNPLEVEAVEWKTVAELQHILMNPTTAEEYVPYGMPYYALLLRELTRVTVLKASLQV